MNKIKIAAVSVSAAILFSIPLAAKDVFRGRMVTGRSSIESAVLTLRFEIEEFTTREDVERLQEVMGRGDINEFISAFRELDKGTIQVRGGRGWKLRINAAHIKYLPEGGQKIFLFLERQSWESLTKMIQQQNPFMMIELTLDENGNGEGRLFDDVQIKLTPDWRVDLEGSYSAPKMITSIQKIG